MLWFNEKKKRKMEFIQNFVPTSKAQLLQVAMTLSGGNIEKAQEFVDFYANNLDLPDFDPIAPSFMQQVKGFFSWAKENQSDIIQGYQLIQGIIKNKGEIVTPIIENGSPLPNINE